MRKGSAAIRSGPRTTGGAINLLSTPIPQQTSGLLNVAYGNDQTVQTHAWAGGSGERSINLEAGVRWNPGALQTELVGFWNHYDNLVGTCTASSGGNCEVGDQSAGGAARVRGIEASLGYDLAQNRGWAFAVPVGLAYTHTDATFRNSFGSAFEEWGTVRSGDQLPYLPEQALNLRSGVEAERWRVNLAGNHIDATRTVAGQGSVPPASARNRRSWSTSQPVTR